MPKGETVGIFYGYVVIVIDGHTLALRSFLSVLVKAQLIHVPTGMMHYSP